MRRQAWEAVGGFPENLRSAEDLLFMNKVEQAGFRAVRAPLDRANVADLGLHLDHEEEAVMPVIVAQMVPAFGSLTEPLGDGAMLATWMLIRAARARAPAS